MPYGKNRATARSQERPPTDVGEDPANDDELPPVDYGEHRDRPPHLGEPSSSRVDDPRIVLITPCTRHLYMLP